MADETPIVMGRIAGPYGIKGWVHVVSFTTPLDNLLDYRPWYLARDRRWQAVEVLEEIVALDPLDGEALMLLGEHHAEPVGPGLLEKPQ